MLTAAEVAALLGIAPRTVYDLARSGALPHFRPAPGAVRFAWMGRGFCSDEHYREAKAKSLN